MYRVQEDPKYELVSKVGSITLEYGVDGAELERELNSARLEFIDAMLKQGYLLYEYPGLENPKWAMDGRGNYTAWYAIDWEGKRARKHEPSGLLLSTKREYSLEESDGEVEYRCVGVFWSPKRSLEMIVHRQQIKDQERAVKNPTSFGPAGNQVAVAPLLLDAERQKEYEDDLEG